MIETVKLIIDLSVSAFFRTYLRFMKDVSINKCQSFLRKYYPSTSAVSEKVLIWFGAFLTDLSKALDCILHDLLISELHAYGVDMKSLRFLYSYLNGRKQRVKIDDKYSLFEEILFGVPQGSILEP